jgi:tellurite resistance protein
MFLHALTTADQELFCQAALSLMQVDGVVREREQDLCDALMRETSLDSFPKDVSAVHELAPELRRLAGSRAGRIVLLELSGVALADGELDASELDWLREAASALGSSEDDLRRFCDFAASASELAAEARMLVFEPETEPLPEA